MRPLLCLLAAAAVLGAAAPAAAGAAGFTQTELFRTIYEGPPIAPVEVELDGDPEPERVGLDAADPFAKRAYVEDACGGTVRRLALGRADEFHGVRLLRTADDPGAPRLFQEGSSGATGRNGAAVLARLPAGTPADPCPRLRVLFRLPNPAAGPWRLPRGPRGTYAGSFSVLPRDLRADLPGEELVVRVGRYRRTDAGCCPSYIQTSSWRHDAARDRFIRYRTTVRRTRAAGR
jgi:hypothetical protein